ncbi:uncharacterized protein LOC111608662 [Xiphophorus maculatus]|uniref:uncharacterized protein LOC111608662 n=1 Tax=Xiphophorus maculatus TaxID=8083 RepID=UPI000C6C944A|nr:uncharacterized protein LOC111608662 [Xiphophorus maculatus]
MCRVLGDLIHPDQACAVPGRRITDSLVLIRDIICFARDRNIRLIVLNLDFEKAFDRVSHQYLFQVLQKMGFPGRFVAWVGLLYRDISSRFMVNGFLTKAVKVNCGVRQGCPLSALLYVACVEPLAQILRRDPQILGVTIPGSGGQDREPVTPVRGLLYGDASTVWRNVSHPVLPNRLQDLSWMVAHGILPVRAVMHSRGMSATAICPRPGCGAPESVRHLLWECSAAVDLWAKAGSLQFPHLPAREVLEPQLVLYGVSQLKIKKKDFAEMWLTLATIKDAIWTSRNLLVSRRRQMPPVAVIRMAAAKRATSRAAGGAPRTQPPRRIACASVDEGAGAPRAEVQAAAAWLSG